MTLRNCTDGSASQMSASTMLKPTELDYYYKLLNVPPTATAAQIKAAYHTLARQYHPDKQYHSTQGPNSVNVFLEIQKAYECLRSESSRASYDESQRLQKARQTQEIHKSILLNMDECRWERVGEGIDDSGDGDNDEVMEWMLVYECRCGGKVDVTPFDEEEADGSPENSLVECPDCSLVYNVSQLQANDSDS